METTRIGWLSLVVHARDSADKYTPVKQQTLTPKLLMQLLISLVCVPCRSRSASHRQLWGRFNEPMHAAAFTTYFSMSLLFSPLFVTRPYLCNVFYIKDPREPGVALGVAPTQLFKCFVVIACLAGGVLTVLAMIRAAMNRSACLHWLRLLAALASASSTV